MTYALFIFFILCNQVINAMHPVAVALPVPAIAAPAPVALAHAGPVPGLFHAVPAGPMPHQPIMAPFINEDFLQKLIKPHLPNLNALIERAFNSSDASSKHNTLTSIADDPSFYNYFNLLPIELRRIIYHLRLSQEKTEHREFKNSHIGSRALRADIVSEATKKTSLKAEIAKAVGAPLFQPFGETLLHIYCQNGFTDAAELLINRDKQIEFNVKEGSSAIPGLWNSDLQRVYDHWTALHIVAYQGNCALIKILLDCGAHAALRDKQGQIPLFYAAAFGHADAVKLLLPVSAVDENELGKSLLVAANNGHCEVVDILLAAGANVNFYAPADGTLGVLLKGAQVNYTALMLAVEQGHREVVERLLKVRQIQIDHVSRTQKETALMIACHHGHLAIVRELVEKGAHINVQNKNGWSPLMIAAEKGYAYIVNFLLNGEMRVNLNALNQHGHSALYLASRWGHEEVVKQLLSADALVKDADGSDRNGIDTKPLIGASRFGRVNVVTILLLHHKHHTKTISLALGEAVRNGHVACVEILLESFDAEERVKIANRILILSARHQSRVVEFIINNYKQSEDTIKEALRGALTFAYTSATHYLVEQLRKEAVSIDLETTTFKVNEVQKPSQCSPLAFAARIECLPLLHAFLTISDADQQKMMAARANALKEAIDAGKVESVRMLLSAGAEKDFEQVYSTSVLQAALDAHKVNIAQLCMHKQIAVVCNSFIDAAATGNVKQLTTLMKTGIDLNQPNEYGQTALNAALFGYHIPCVKALLEAGASGNFQRAEYSAGIVSLDAEKNVILQVCIDGRNVTIPLYENVRPLLSACTQNNLTRIDALLKIGLDAENIRESLRRAIQQNNAPIMHLIVNQTGITDFASPTFEPCKLIPNRFCPLEVVAMNGCIPLLQAFLSIPADDIVLFSALSLAMRNNQPEAVKHLLAVCDEPIKSAAWKSAFQASPAIVNCFIQNDKSGTEKHIEQAIVTNNQALLYYLKDKGADLECTNANGETPLFIAASERNLACVNIVLSAHVNLDKVNNDGFSAIAIALFKFSNEIVTLLLERGANPTITWPGNISGQIVLSDSYPLFQLSVDGNRYEFSRSQLGNRSILQQVLDMAIHHSCIDFVQKILSMNYLRGYYCLTELIDAAVKENQQSILKMLIPHLDDSHACRVIQKGIESKNVELLHLVAEYKLQAIGRLLCRFAYEGKVEELQMLLNLPRVHEIINTLEAVGACNAKTALMFAAQYGHRHCVEMLLKAAADPLFKIKGSHAFHVTRNHEIRALLAQYCPPEKEKEIRRFLNKRTVVNKEAAASSSASSNSDKNSCRKRKSRADRETETRKVSLPKDASQDKQESDSDKEEQAAQSALEIARPTRTSAAKRSLLNSKIEDNKDDDSVDGAYQDDDSSYMEQ